MRSYCRVLSHAALFSFCSLSLLVPCAMADHHNHRLPPPPSEGKHLGLGHHGDPSPIDPTPEPASLVLFGSGLLIIGGVMRRRNRRQTAANELSASATGKQDTESSVASSLPC